MRFQKASPCEGPASGVLVYRPGEYSFAIEPLPLNGSTSILVNDLSLEVDETNRIISVWGLCPHPGWERTALSPPPAEFCDIFVVADAPLEAGISRRINPDCCWPMLADCESGWVCVSSRCGGSSYAKIFSGVILELDEVDQLCAIWLKPQRFPELS